MAKRTAKRERRTAEYDFRLSFRLPDSEVEADEWLGVLSATCDDATVGIGRPGRIALDFSRSGKSADSAMQSALTDVLGAIPGSELIEASPDYVGVADIAEVMGVSRQRVRAVVDGAADFPLPVHEGSSALYHLAPILEWLDRHDHRAVDAAYHGTARAAMRLNASRGTAVTT